MNYAAKQLIVLTQSSFILKEKKRPSHYWVFFPLLVLPQYFKRKKMYIVIISFLINDKSCEITPPHTWFQNFGESLKTVYNSSHSITNHSEYSDLKNKLKFLCPFSVLPSKGRLCPESVFVASWELHPWGEGHRRVCIIVIFSILITVCLNEISLIGLKEPAVPRRPDCCHYSPNLWAVSDCITNTSKNVYKQTKSSQIKNMNWMAFNLM